jgi:hypothetical protein
MGGFVGKATVRLIIKLNINESVINVLDGHIISLLVYLR